MTSKEYKELSVKEFTKAAEVYESDNAGVYNMCKKDYPDVLASRFPTFRIAAAEQVRC